MRISLKRSVMDYLEEHIPARKMLEKMENIGKIYLIGGVLREFQDHNSIQYLRDIDIVIDVFDEKEWGFFLQNYKPTKNEFGGNKFKCSGLIFDAWRIEETWAFRNRLVPFKKQEEAKCLINTVYLNLDGIVYDWTNEQWHMKKYREAMQSRILDVVLKENPKKELNLARACVLRDRYDMEFSDRLSTEFEEYFREFKNKEEGINKIYEIAKRRYVDHGKYQIEDVNMIVREYLLARF